MRQLIKVVLCLCMCLMCVPTTVFAEEDGGNSTETTTETETKTESETAKETESTSTTTETTESTEETESSGSSDTSFSNTSYWNDLCTQNGSTLSQEQRNSCKLYINSLSSQSADLNKQLEEIEAQRAIVAKDVQTYAEKIRGYDSFISGLNAQIGELNDQIVVLVQEIDAKQADIEYKENEIETVKQKFRDRMVHTQETMRLNQYLDIIMGSKDLNDLIRRTNAINDIAEYDEKEVQRLNVMIDELNKAIEELEAAKLELDEKKAEIQVKANSMIVLRQEAAMIEEEYRKQMADLESQGNRIAGDIEAIQSAMKEIQEQLNAIAVTPGWSYPVPGATISAGTWAYPSGGVHLGEDFAASPGTPIYAVGNGVVMKSVDGCGVGYLGPTCGGAQGGSTSGGNQIYLLTNINGSLYAVKYLHMLAGTPIAQGSIVTAGQYIGAVGSSGNSSGPHCHIEVFYLGAGTIGAFAAQWNGDLAFGCGWGSTGIATACERGNGAPCRVRPETVFVG